MMMRLRLITGIAVLSLLAGCAAPGSALPEGDKNTRPTAAPTQASSPTLGPEASASDTAPALVPQIGTSEPASSVDPSTLTPGEDGGPLRITPPAQGEPYVITSEHDRGTLTLNLGEQLLLLLGEGYDWTVTISDDASLTLVEPPAQGTQGLYQAAQPGTVELTAIGDPICRKTKPPCGMPTVLFRLVVVVQ